MLFLHKSLNEPISVSNLRGIAHCIELLKAVQYTYYRKSMVVAETVMHIVRLEEVKLEEVLRPMKEALEAQLGSAKRGAFRQVWHSRPNLSKLLKKKTNCCRMMSSSTCSRS